MILWLLNKLFATGDVYEDVSEDLPYEIGDRVGGGTFGSVYVASVVIRRSRPRCWRSVSS